METYRVNEPQIIHQTVDDETVIVDLASGSYYSLRGSAQVIWSALERGLGRSAVIEGVEARFEGDGSQMASAIDDFITNLLKDGLIVPRGEAASAAVGEVGAEPHDGGSPRPGFTPPVVERFDDLQDLILLDPVHEVSEGEGWPYARPSDGG